MVAIKGVARFSIPVSDVARSTRFYTEVVGCRHLSTTPNGQMVFLDAAGLCLILVKRNPPINTVPDNHGGVHQPSLSRMTSTRLHLSTCALTASRSPSRRTRKAAYSNDREINEWPTSPVTLPASSPSPRHARSCQSGDDE
jgi:hypothetical protein